MAVADQQGIEALAAAVVERELPSAVGAPLGPLDPRVEADPVAQREGVGVVARSHSKMCV